MLQLGERLTEVDILVVRGWRRDDQAENEPSVHDRTACAWSGIRVNVRCLERISYVPVSGPVYTHLSGD